MQGLASVADAVLGPQPAVEVRRAGHERDLQGPLPGSHASIRVKASSSPASLPIPPDTGRRPRAPARRTLRRQSRVRGLMGSCRARTCVGMASLASCSSMMRPNASSSCWRNPPKSREVTAVVCICSRQQIQVSRWSWPLYSPIVIPPHDPQTSLQLSFFLEMCFPAVERVGRSMPIMQGTQAPMNASKQR